MSDKYSFIISIPLVPAILLLDHLMSSLWSTLVNTLFPVFNAWSCLARTWLSALSVCLCSCGTNHYLMYSGDFCSGSRWVFAEVQSVRATVTTWVAASVNINNQKWPFESQNSNNVCLHVHEWSRWKNQGSLTVRGLSTQTPCPMSYSECSERADSLSVC